MRVFTHTQTHTHKLSVLRKRTWPCTGDATLRNVSIVPARERSMPMENLNVNIFNNSHTMDELTNTENE